MTKNCPNCGTLVHGQTTQCAVCGAVLSPQPQARGSTRPSSRTTLLILAAAAGLLMLVGVWYMLLEGRYLLWPFSGPPGVPTVVSGSRGVNLKPLPGVHITAPRNAMDHTREVRFAELGQAGIDRLGRELDPSSGSLPLRAFELDTGMGPEDRYPGNMTLSFDLKKLGVPKSLWQDLQVVQIEDNGTVLWLVGRHNGRRIDVDVDRNSIVGIVVIGALASLIPIDMWWKDSTKLPGGPFIPFALPDCPGFIIHLSGRKLPMQDPGEVARVLAAMNALRAPLGLPAYQLMPEKAPWFRVNIATLNRSKLPTIKAMIQAEAELRDTGAWQKLEELWRSPVWLKKNLIPARVLNVGKALTHARWYLKDFRAFKYPTFVIDVYISAKKLAGFGYQDDLWFGHPFIIVSGDKVSQSVPGDTGWTAHDQSCFNGLNLTLLHELFHVVQTRYYWSPSVFGTDTWFFEATAVALEAEAGKTYLSKSDWHITAWNGTIRDYSGFRDQLAFAWQTTHQHQQHGYSISYLLEYLRDTYYSKQPSAFLPRLLNDYSGFLGGALNSLWRITTGDATSFGKTYLNFCRKHGDDMFLEGLPRSMRPLLSPKNPVYLWKHTKFLELRCPVLDARVVLPKTKVKKGENAAVVVVKDEAANTLEMPGAYEIRWWDPLTNVWKALAQTGSLVIPSDWQGRVKGSLKEQKQSFVNCEELVSIEVTSPAGVAQQTAKGGLPLRFERIEHQVFTGVDSWNRSAGKGMTVFAMYKPTSVPSISIDRDEQKMDFDVKPSALAKKKLIDGYLIHFKLFQTKRSLWQTTPASRTQVGPELTVFLKLGKHTIDISPLLELTGSKSEYNPLLAKGFTVRGLKITPKEVADWLDISNALGGNLEELEVTYNEVASLKAQIWGPTSDTTIGSLPAPEDQSFGPSGHWEGTTWLIRVPITMDLRSMGSKVKGEISVRGEALPVSGEWNAAEKAWVLDVPFGQVYLRRVANHGLWLPAPPTVLRNPRWEAGEKERRKRAEKKGGGFLEWIGWRSPPPTPPIPQEAGQ